MSAPNTQPRFFTGPRHQNHEPRPKIDNVDGDGQDSTDVINGSAFCLLPQDERAGTDSFYCKNCQEETLTAICLQRFADDNAFKVPDSPCWKCQQGGRIRADFACS